MTERLLHRLRRLIAPPSEGTEHSAYRIRLIVGLGNPGKEYANNRHNVGAWVVNRLARRHGIDLKTSGQALLGRGRVGDAEVALARPLSYVNMSGPVVWNLVKRLGLDDAQELLVVCDDLDLPLGKVRLRPQGSHGGHNGLKSIVEATGSDAFPRLRIGIGRPTVRGEPTWDPDVIADYVLSDPPPEERAALDEAVESAIGVIEAALAEGVEQAMAEYN